MSAGDDILTHSQIVVTVGEFGDFEQATGGDVKVNVTPYFEAGAKVPRKITSTGDQSDLVVTRAYRPGRDGALVDWVKHVRDGTDMVARTAVKKYLNALGVVVDTQTYSVRAIDVKTPDSKAGDTAIAEVQLTLAVEAVL